VASYDPRWGDDPRDRHENSRDLSQGSRGGSDPRDRERLDPRDVFMDHVSLPRGREREHVRYHGHDYTLRGSETRTLTTVGAFRAVPAHDLRDRFDQPLDPRHGELWRLPYASMYDCRHNRAHIYHVNQRAVYAAIGDPQSRLRKPVTLNHAIQRLMVLDAIVEDPDLVWLGTAEEKSTHLTTLLRIEAADLPHIYTGEGDRAVRYFADRRSEFTPPAGAWSSTSSPIPGWMNSASFSCATLPCSGHRPRGRSGSSCRRTSRTSVSGPNRLSGIS
jgi:hypothetical protein